MSRLLINNRIGRHISILSRMWSGNGAPIAKHSESHLKQTLENRFPKAKEIIVTDISGGCGAMYEIMVETQEFKGLTTIKQHRLVTELLKNEIKDMHGLRIHTSIPKDD